ncbi:MAG: ATP synthase F1 subunit epsilon [Candidatus Taylorbacteria bacterium RIFCSPLOWO2_12_FULL_43_20]|uniref:ATP synthase epsilon chain n=1 Tax=Candidatus Taylorbacteria bacterium RIFCSPLOWO2_12_FULL_43_20 TaxID=1802332 RepID=A0A1G2NZI2_9BACT|nr:MAG: ATP synthase F1 subunit epsilon [Candidatus Taylorbacteria bacterium RIFCSPHIGHO2_01_FULL_43_120]OHA23703.1 MAG: ATP synthase F1 subunit epsilon [Candidatus Taylorbacteria bacterium RIFCSPHIGHO2_02_FULL_43_55]OHA27956.1 MAG: ATP synthase F1 subunit epsilon [Candidatus Taylorbacteria bacterium RIFCSPHIGHO2_12_FULL_42_34]OHA32051.1 MAG: ATP synthase F1 subunit epsilon [Candidatus Taylorbacteria bacterium RIFCSPLOWO2_01_FULL_43_83]OHA39801.1 MAG: ATP synthase F1 subunit epsilon [Candidatus
MSKLIKLKIVTPEKLILEDMVDQVTLPTQNGEITILPDHIPLIAGLASGDIVGVSNGEHIPMAVSGGFVEVKKENEVTAVTVLADFAEHVSELSEAEVIKAKNRAEELKKQMENKETVDYEHFAVELERSLTRVKIADKWKVKKYRK